MKPILRKIDAGHNSSFSIREDIYPFLYNHWHYHPETELTYIRKGTGMRLVGDNMERFMEGDMILLGPDLPHLWRSDAQYFEGRRDLHIEAIAIHFSEAFWGDYFLDLPELKPVKHLLHQSKRGIKIHGETKRMLVEKMEAMLQATEAHRISGLLDILQCIASTGEYSFITTSGYNKASNISDHDKINSIYSYTLANFKRQITMVDVADAAGINPNSFCRYFKTRTLKTYWRFLLEVRIGHACKLLIEDKMQVAEVCIECGFKNVSNFNRHFKSILKMNPRQYVKAYLPTSANSKANIHPLHGPAHIESHHRDDRKLYMPEPVATMA
jgi:AraC-like DNA-binding protein